MAFFDENAPIVTAETPLMPAREDTVEAVSTECSCHKILTSAVQRFTPSKRTRRDSYPRMSDIPITSLERLAQSAVDPDPNTESPTVPKTYLYLAYGSNLAAETFLGHRGIRPISRINVNAPAFDLNFGLPGLPYWEPCFANIEPRRKLPEPKPPLKPPKPPINPPKPPPIDPTPKPGPPVPYSLLPALPPKGPEWNKGLYGVVYEVTAEDFATIVKTEGGGASYKDIQTPCIALPPQVHVPEGPPIPELPRPFLAHTLYAPRIPKVPGQDGDNDNDDNDPGRDDRSKLRKWLARFLLPVNRPADYAQPSLRYLTLIRTGAAENYLPDEYQQHLASLHHYAVTTRRQTIGKFFYALFFFPLMAFILIISRLLADKETGKVPNWLGLTMTVLVNIMWGAYDHLWKGTFGDGERTEDGKGEGKDENGQKWNFWTGYGHGDRKRRRSFIGNGGIITDEEKNRLLEDW